MVPATVNVTSAALALALGESDALGLVLALGDWLADGD